MKFFLVFLYFWMFKLYSMTDRPTDQVMLNAHYYKESSDKNPLSYIAAEKITFLPIALRTDLQICFIFFYWSREGFRLLAILQVNELAMKLYCEKVISQCHLKNTLFQAGWKFSYIICTLVCIIILHNTN